MTAALLTLLTLLILAAGAGAESAGKPSETLTGYYEDRAYVRPAMVLTTDYLAVIPAYTVVTLEKADESWAVYRTPEGKEGYLRTEKLKPVPEYEPDPEQYVYSEDRIQVHGLPSYESPAVYTAAPRELLTADGHVKGFRHVRAEDGTAGYILPYGIREAVFTPRAMTPVPFCVTEEKPVMDMPLQGAHRVGTLETDRFYLAEGTCGDYYALTLDGETVYAEKSQTVLCGWNGGEDRSFFTLPKAGRAGRGEEIRPVFLCGSVRPEGAVLRRPRGTDLSLPGGADLYLYSACGAWYGASWGTEAGYILREDAEALDAGGRIRRLRQLDLSGGRIGRSALLDQGLAMTEEGNPFQARYNLLTGARVKSTFPLGIPYFWGGRNYRAITERLPAYTTREAWQSSPVFYQQGTVYLYGFDCVGLVKGVYSLAGMPVEGTLSGRRAEEYCRAGAHIYCDNAHPLPEDWAEAARGMKVGDIMMIHHPGTHAMMYMGTLRDYGYTAEQLPALADFLDYPLMLQAGANPYSYLRFQSLIASSADPRISEASPPDGSVCVCILGVPREKAEIVMECHDETYYGFDVEGSCVTIMGCGSVTDYFVFRPGAEAAAGISAPEGAEDETEAAGGGPEEEAETGNHGDGPENETEAAGDGPEEEAETGNPGDGPERGETP